MKTYFETQQAIDKAANEKKNEGFEIEYGVLTCACGQTNGYKIMNDQYCTLEVLIFCESCYDDAAFKERGE